MTMVRRLARLPFIFAAAVTWVGAAGAQDYPTRPITLVVPQAPGGGNDVIARILADHMSRLLGQQIVVENRTGAGGTLGTRQVAKSAPDGYTLGMGSTGTMAIAPTAYPNAGYDPRRDFAPVGLIARSAIALVVGPSVSAANVRELIKAAKDNPGKLTYGSGGAGSGNHLAGVLFGMTANVKLTHVPFRGANPAITDVIGGHVDMIFSSLPPTLGSIRDGKLRVLGMATRTRSTVLPDVPTIDEAGLPGFEAEQRYGLIAPAGTPDAVIARLNAVLRQALASPEVIQRIASDGAVPMPSSPQEYVQDIDRDETKWAPVVREAGPS
jgi:tripartite-type tricarboxylate transporter receptor subunit TctC